MRWWKQRNLEHFEPSNQREAVEWINIAGEAMRWKLTPEAREKMIQKLLEIATDMDVTTNRRIQAMDLLRKLDHLNLEYDIFESSKEGQEEETFEVIDEQTAYGTKPDLPSVSEDSGESGQSGS